MFTRVIKNLTSLVKLERPLEPLSFSCHVKSFITLVTID